MSLSSAIEACRVPDERLAEAYEGTSALHRSWIKTTLALVESVHPALPSRSERRTEDRDAGFGFVRTEETAPWAVLLIGEGYASAVRLAAAIMPARLAGVEPILAVWAGSGTPPPALFAALELTGVEQVFAMPDPLPLLRELRGHGRVLAFGLDLPPLPYPCWRDAAPRIAADALPDEELIRWAHPDALSADGGADVLYPEQFILGDDREPLRLGEGLEGCWLHAELTPGFFMNTRLELFALDAD